MNDYRRHVNFNKFARKIVIPFTRLKFNYEFEKVSVKEGPILLLCNHNTDFDPIFLGLAADRFVYFVATEKIARMGLLSKFVKRYFDPILHAKGVSGIGTVKAIMSKIRKGHSVAMFPEGNRSFNGVTCPIPSSTGKLARACGGTLVTYRLSGGYLTSPRWSASERKGKIVGKQIGIYTHDMLKAMTDEEINDAISKDLYVDAYKDQMENKIAYKGKNLAENLESTIFMCPKCRRMGKMSSSGEKFYCECGFSSIYDVYGMLAASDGSIYSVTDLDNMQRSALEERYLSGDEGEFFKDVVVCEEINTGHEKVKEEEKVLSAYRDRIEIGDRAVPISEIEGIAISQKNLLIIHISGLENHYELRGDKSFNALKYLYLVRAAGNAGTGTI